VDKIRIVKNRGPAMGEARFAQRQAVPIGISRNFTFWLSKPHDF
jgi:hypothetical protein